MSKPPFAKGGLEGFAKKMVTNPYILTSLSFNFRTHSLCVY
jgi:hypothetical protein